MATNQVPRMHQVIPGALVNIVLKADQRTGRQVRGTVQQVLTKGDHHRGIKVRLTDGRIGRVQSMSQLAPDADSTVNLASAPPEVAPSSRGQGPHFRYRDIRLEEPPEAPPEQIDLGAYIVSSRRKARSKQVGTSSSAGETANSANDSNSGSNEAKLDVASAVVTCPVCEAFQGDEAAVAHHVTEHFGA
ncbi:hypothetical protein GGS20DRAFT_424473 [Poronia punctata]|nr:hypothetical protein GGS20DRAFT_424473 [Poronia punctata]